MPGWEGSTRRQTLPRNWYTTVRPEIIQRDRNICQWPDEDGRAVNRHGEPICGRPGSDVDHIDDRDDHRPANLRLLCSSCHDRRSAQQGGQSFTPLHRPPEQHPVFG